MRVVNIRGEKEKGEEENRDDLELRNNTKPGEKMVTCVQ